MASRQINQDINRDLGLGSRLAQDSRQRFLNRDGSFNVDRLGLPFFRSLNLYHWLLTISWPSFFLLLTLGYLVANLAFASAYILCGPEALRGANDPDITSPFLNAFFFSVQTVATIGYGSIRPVGVAANLIVTIEALVGLLGFALATGLLFARFSRPNAKILFSSNAIISPYQGVTALKIRIANARSSQLTNVSANLTLSRLETIEGRSKRRFYDLALERRMVILFPLHWVIVHPIDESSPLSGVTREEFDATDPELLVLLNAIDEATSQPVHVRSSYKYSEVLWNVNFADIFLHSRQMRIGIDLRRLSDVDAQLHGRPE